MIRGYLNILTLKAVAEGPKTGYQLMKYVQGHIGSKPSPGSIYPLLEQLKTQELITVKGVGRTNEYKITLTGKQKLTQIEQKRTEALTSFLEGMKMISALTGENLEFPMAMVEHLRKGHLPFKEINPEWDLLRTKLFTLMTSGNLKKHAAHIKKTLARANKEIEHL